MLLFARREGFRFSGKLIKPGEDEVALRMIRIGERPAPELHTLPEPIPREEAQVLARRLIQPCWEVAIAQKDQGEANWVLAVLASVDPVDVLQKLETGHLVDPSMVPGLKIRVALALARSDPARAEKVVESIDSPSRIGAALWEVAEALPREERDRQLALLGRADVHVRAAKQPDGAVRVAGSLNNLGEKEKAKALVAECFRPAKVKPQLRAALGPWLARIDPPAAVSIARELPASNRQDANRILWNVAIALAEGNPAKAERVLRLVPQEKGQSWMHPALAWKLAMRDSARARRLADESQRYDDSPQTYLYLAYGLKKRDPAAAEAAFWKGIREIDRLLEQGSQYFAMKIQGGPAAFLPLVEQIDPTLVPEVFWRALAARCPLDPPRSLDDLSLVELAELVAFLAWYDREAAAAVFEADRVMRERAPAPVLFNRFSQFASWALRDARAALAELDHLHATNDQDAKIILQLREYVGERLGLPYEDKWRTTWYQYGYGKMSIPLDRDIW